MSSGAPNHDNNSSPVIQTVEMHTGGEPVRIIVKGYPQIPSDTNILAKRSYVRDNLDHLRRMLMFEPRGSEAMYGALIVEKDLPEASLAVLFMHGEGYSTMCGHATISLGRYAIDYGIVPPVTPLTTFTMQCPCGPVKVKVQYENNKSGAVSFESVPSFVDADKLNQSVYVPSLNKSIPYDISYGGAFYAFVDVGSVGLDFKHSSMAECREIGGSITDELRKTIKLSHPDPSASDLEFLYGTILISSEGQQLCIFAERQVDRSPCGSGVSARLALEYHQKKIKLGEAKRISNPLTGSVFGGQATREEKFFGVNAVVTEVKGNGYYTGESKFWLEEGDKIGEGFLL
ncbi:PREDICTED: trans-L-3-hydroxyproline dehydratase-like [Amphimedon queenslandica]|uniref:trans-L-3-hydroxyproline dehydratase n=1 Tax=Amphimedon queenslandica TaxID=400682 RepID=A0A1X7VKQ7_AMPQE|nr:PREDICTED: trans-L-3-hydroxyproline dehydratase-like [Amphimedon queenslandica]|eukprot:XP_011409784.2 PREDICTED: trans-L-3-hydroxyproline dehydratase-like [Amphimedon queenslandica]